MAVTKIGLAAKDINSDAIELVEGTLERLKRGDVTSVAIVEVRRGRSVAHRYSKSVDYHLLNSGAARLAACLATDPGEIDPEK